MSFLPWYETAAAATPSKEERVGTFTTDGALTGSFPTPDGFISAGGQVLPTANAAAGTATAAGEFPLEVYSHGPLGATAESAPTGGNPADRLRSGVNESVTSLLESVEARPVDARAGEDFTFAQTLEATRLRSFVEVTQGAASFAYYPRPRQNSVHENQYDGITVLGRLASYYPGSVVDTVTNLGIGSSGVATASEVITYVLGLWAAALDWFSFQAVPDLRLRLSGMTPADYGATDGLVTTAAVRIDQDGDSRRDALSILQDLLSPFPGTIVRQNSVGSLVIVPTYGPDADAAPVVTLTPLDCYTVSEGAADPFTIFNRATVRNAGQSLQENVAVMQPAWFQVGSNLQLGNPATGSPLTPWFEPPSARVNLQPPSGSDTVLQESLSNGQFGAQRPNGWPVSSSVIPAGTGIKVQDSMGAPLITAAWREYSGGATGSPNNSGSGAITMIHDGTIPFSGATVDLFRWDEGLFTLTIRARWDAASETVQFSFGPAAFEANCWNGCEVAIVEFTLNDASSAYAEGQPKSGSFGVLEDGDSLPTASGGNAIYDSQSEYGVREANLEIRGYDLDPLTLEEIARAYVLQNITPRVTREIELSVAGARVGFDHIGRVIELPSGETGVLVSLDYADAFALQGGSWRKVASVQLLDPAGAGATDETGGSFWVTERGDGSAGDPYNVEGQGPLDPQLLLNPFYNVEEGI